MKVKQIIVVHKKSSYQKSVLDEKSAYFQQLVRKKNLSVKEWPSLHEEHMSCLKLVEETLRRYDIPFKSYNRFKIKTPIRADLIITVGGDGTFLETSHYVHRQPMLGVNSAPGSSIGHFTTATAKTFEKQLKNILAGKAKLKIIQRLQAYRGRKKFAPPALNEILFASQHPASTSRYWMREIRTGKGERLKGKRSLLASKARGKGRLHRALPVEGATRTPLMEEQKSSGVWIATPAGSTAAIRSAGGKKLPMEAVKFSYAVRELYRRHENKHHYHTNVLESKDALEILVKMDDAALFVDGSHISYPVKRGETITFRLSSEPLQMIA